MSSDHNSSQIFRVEEHPGIAFHIRGYVERDTPDTEWSGIKEVDYTKVRAVMIGDDKEHIIDIDSLSPITDEVYCDECGQLGCAVTGALES